ncbi:MAG: DUF4838 domain-containing protein, partial [Lentisphaerae bacterium]|nr:DUF4838 domain-containing protein [Lentisphaerota bacterium]
AEPIGVLYGAYEVLKRYGGIRWLVPGDDGEYFTVKPTIAVPEGGTVKNPDFAVRRIGQVAMSSLSLTRDTWAWCSRNNLRLAMIDWQFANPKLHDELERHAVKVRVGGHCFTPLLTGWNVVKRTPAEYKEYVERLFAEHPEYFPLINGKRVISYDGGNDPQPCTSNPDVIQRVARNAALSMKKCGYPSVYLDFCNNDCTRWCQCKACRAIDPQAEKEAGIVSTRYWTFANAVLAELRKEWPGAQLAGWTYQNYSLAPVGVKPDKRVLHVRISNHRRCWKHALNDPNCSVNKWYYEYNKSWNDAGAPLVTYEMLSTAGRNFLPNEKNWVDTLKYYKHAMPNVQGMATEISCPDGEYSGGPYDTPMTRNNWYMMWQALYLGMYFHWDVRADYDQLHEEINALYYGQGWDGGMREFRKYLTELYMNAGGCWGYAHSIPVGKFLDVPGAREKLYMYLDAAEQAAASDPDKRALAHVKRDREFFEMTWVKAWQDYIGNYREIRAYPLQGTIVVDGELKEADWKNADVVTRFKTPGGAQAKYQTAVKLAYDTDNIYIGIECLEPAPDKIKTDIRDHDGPVWEDNDVEIFLNDPILGGAYFQVLINAAGVVCDGSVQPGQNGITRSFESGAEVKTLLGEDRWFMEIRLPAKPITGGVLTAGSILKINVMRCRVLAENRKESETSTWSMGTPHNVETFHTVSFAAPRAVTAGNRHEIDTRLWRNGSFNEIAQNPRIPKGWKVKDGQAPARWGFSDGYLGELEYRLHPGSQDNYFVRLIGGGFIANDCGLTNETIGAVCRLRGQGALRFCILRYSKEGNNLPSVQVHKEQVDSAEWEPVAFEYARPGDKEERQSLFLWPEGADSTIDIDDLYLVPK